MAHGQRTRYDYRNDYKGMTLEQLKVQEEKTLDRMLDFLGLDNRVSHDFGKRNSYIKQLIAKIENEKTTTTQTNQGTRSRNYKAAK